MASPADKLRRPGYAPAANAGVGRRGLHTRDRILASAAEVFLANGFHSTSLDTIARAAKSSRATVHQYFAGKEDVFGELSAAAERDGLDHGERLGSLRPTADGVDALYRWLVEWATLYDAHAAAFPEYPGVGTELGIVGVGTVAATFGQRVTAQLEVADLGGLETRASGSNARHCRFPVADRPDVLSVSSKSFAERAPMTAGQPSPRVTLSQIP